MPIKMEKDYEIYISLFSAHVHTHINILIYKAVTPVWWCLIPILFNTRPSLLYNGEETFLFGHNALQ